MRTPKKLISLMLLVIALQGETSWAKTVGRDAVSAPVRNLCGELLTNPDLEVSVDVSGAPGLRLLKTELYGSKPDYKILLSKQSDAFHPHELISSARYAKYIKAAKGEVLLMVPGIEHKSIPGFDGVVFDAKGTPIANYSLKTLLSANGDNAAIKKAFSGVEQAKNFSYVERWFTFSKLLFKDESGHYRPANAISQENLLSAKRWLSKAMGLFGLKAPTDRKRPTRVVVDIQSEADLPDREDLNKVRRWINESEGMIESIIFIKGREVIEVKSSD